MVWEYTLLDWFSLLGWLINNRAICIRIALLFISTSTGTAVLLIFRSQAKRQTAYCRHEHLNSNGKSASEISLFIAAPHREMRAYINASSRAYKRDLWQWPLKRHERGTLGTLCNRRNRKVSLLHNRCAPRKNASSLVHNRPTEDIPWKYCATDEIEYFLCHTTGAPLEQTRIRAYTTNLQKEFPGNTVQQMK